MQMLTLLLALSAIIWYVVDRAKPLWANLSWGKYLTIAVVAVLAAAAVFTYGLDILCAVAVTETVTIVGEILTVLVLMSGSSAVSEVVSRIKGE